MRFDDIVSLLGTGLAVIGGLAAALQLQVSRHRAVEATRQADAARQRARHELDATITGLAPSDAAPSLDEELGEVSQTLSATMTRLHDISERAKAYENEIQGLVEKAEIAKAAAALHEEDARKIAILVGAESQARLKEEIDRLSEAHTKQIDALKKSGNRTAWITFIGGAIVGFGVNILTTLMMS